MDGAAGHADRLDETPVIVVTAYGGGKAAIEAMKLGAYDYITKPFDFDEVLFSIGGADAAAPAAQVQALSERSARRRRRRGIGRPHPEMLQVFKTIGRVAPTREPVLIPGESGTGKELAANAIHTTPTRGQPFVKVNSAALSPTLLESELFGHEKGAFTGAVARRTAFRAGGRRHAVPRRDRRIGRGFAGQAAARAATRRFERVGGEEALQVDVRVMAATNRDLPARIAEGRFREDLTIGSTW